MKLGKSHDRTEATAAREIECDHLVLSHAVKIAIGTEAQPARLAERRKALGGPR